MTTVDCSIDIASSRKEAIFLGLNMYIGKPCLHGNIAPRFLRTGNCTCDVCRENQKKICRNFARKKRSTKIGAQAHRDAQNRYYKNNAKKQTAYYANRRKIDPSFYCATKARAMLSRVLRRANKKKNARCVDLIGYSGDDLRLHIERQFTKGMEWAKVGKEIEIDHIIPVAKMIADGITDPAIINALSNLRPVWKVDNREKRAKILTLL